MKKKLFSIVVIVMVCALVFAACSTPAASPAVTEEAPATQEAAPSAEETEVAAPAGDNSALNIQVVAKGFQHQFWQVVMKGSEAAAADLGVGTMDFQGPEGESAINTQVEMLNAALAKDPNAICLAALDTESVKEQLQQAMDAGIPIIGFDSGVPDAPEGSILATASTDNEAAAALAAAEMMKDEAFSTAVANATADAPVTIAILSQDATSASIIGRTKGYLDAIKVACEGTHPNAVAVTGHDMYKAESAEPAAVIINVQVPPSPEAADMKNGAQAILNLDNLIGVFCSNEGAVTGFLNATNDGADLDKTDGKYKDLVVAGFDAGSTQKAAVKNGWFLGSVTQDPYSIGYKAVALAVDAANGVAVEDVDTGAKWYSAANMDEPDIAQLLYD